MTSNFTLENSSNSPANVTMFDNVTIFDNVTVFDNVTDFDNVTGFYNVTIQNIFTSVSDVSNSSYVTNPSIVTSPNNITPLNGVTSFLNASTVTDSTPSFDVTFSDVTTSSDVFSTSSGAPQTSERVIEDVIAKGIDFYLPPILFVVGVISNIFVVMTMRSRHFRHMSTSFYMSVSSSVDLVSLLVSLPSHYLYVNFPQVFDNARSAHAMCGFFNLFGWGSSDMGVLLTVAMTTERSLAIKFPLKASTLCTVKRAKIVTVSLFLLEFLKVGHLMFMSRVASKEVTALLCVVDLSSPGYKTFYEQFWPYIHNIFLLISFVIIIIGNVIITVHVRKSEDKDMGGEGQMQKSVGGGAAGKSKMGSKSRQLSLMLIIDSATIVLCTLPFSIYIVISDSIKLFDDTPQGRGMSNLVFAIVFYLLYVNRCANFFLYCVSGARFRTALKDILLRRSSKKNSYITGVTKSRGVSSTASEGGGGAVSMNTRGDTSRNA